MFGPDDTDYTIAVQADGSYAVKALKPNQMPQLIEGFSNEAEAQHWITEKIEGTAAPDPTPADPFHTFRNR